MKVVALSGTAEHCEQFVAQLKARYKVATLRKESENTIMFAQNGALHDLLSIKTPTREVLTHYKGENSDEIRRELDRLGEQEDVELAVVIGTRLASDIARFEEVYKVLLENFEDFEKHFKMLETSPEWMTLGALLRQLRSLPEIHNVGAILTFTGIVRGEAIALEFDVYKREAQRRIGAIASDLKAAEGIVEVQIYHKSGHIKRGEDIVYIVVAAAHREEGFKALREAIERIKKEVPIWKKELTINGETWVGV